MEITESNWAEYTSGVPTFLSACPEIFPVIASQTDAATAYQWIVEQGGASLPARDEVDTYLIDELTSLGGKGTIIFDQRKTEQFPLGGPGNIKTGECPVDSDKDGMPDWFEEKYGLDKNDPSDASRISNNGYSNIENYIFTIGQEK